MIFSSNEVPGPSTVGREPTIRERESVTKPDEAGGDEVVAGLVAAVMAVERKFGHSLRGAESDRHGAIREAIEKSLGGRN